MIKSWIISGDPRTIHTMTRVTALSGLKRLMLPNAITSPSGAAPKSVTKNSRRVCKKPTFRELMTMGSCFIISSMFIPHLSIYAYEQ